MGKKGPGCALVVAEIPCFSYCSGTICAGLDQQVTRAAQRVPAEYTVAQSFVGMKRGFGYTRAAASKWGAAKTHL